MNLENKYFDIEGRKLTYIQETANLHRRMTQQSIQITCRVIRDPRTKAEMKIFAGWDSRKLS